MKEIYIFRHAKAVPAGTYPGDHERPLTPQGQAASKAVGETLRAQKLGPQQVLCSDSIRTRETWDHFVQGFGKEIPIAYTHALYLAPVPVIFSLLHQLPDTTDSVMLIGHNPGMHQLCIELAAKDRNPAWDELDYSFPTANLAIIRCDVTSWGLVESGCGQLTRYISRKQLDDVNIIAQQA